MKRDSSSYARLSALRVVHAQQAHALLTIEPGKTMEPTELALAIVISLALAGALWGPYLWKEIRRGKADLGPKIPIGAGDTHPGTRFDPAPRQPDAQADPYSERAQRNAPPVKS